MEFDHTIKELKSSISQTQNYLSYCLNELIIAKMMASVAEMIEEEYVAPKSYEYGEYDEEDFEENEELAKEFENFDEKTQIVTDFISVADEIANDYEDEIKLATEEVLKNIEEYVIQTFKTGTRADIDSIKDFVEGLTKNHHGYESHKMVGKLDVGKVLNILNDKEFLKICRLKDDKSKGAE